MSVNQKFLIIKDRVVIYRDFTINLLHYIMKYYLDSKTLSDDNDIKNHYNFCFNKVCDEFSKENICFKDNKLLREYFYNFYKNQFYKREIQGNSETITFEFYKNFWDNIFEIEKQKNRNVINTLVELYKFFDSSISKEKNILEIV
jgi:hypothetical protein